MKFASRRLFFISSSEFTNACLFLFLLVPFLVLAGAGSIAGPVTVAAAFSPPRPTQSSPIALGKSERYLLNVNPDANTVTVFQQLPHRLKKFGEIRVGREPSSVAIKSQTAYVANSRDGTVSIIHIPSRHVRKTLDVGTEPMAVALSPNESRLYVANSASNTLTVVDTTSDTIVSTIDLSPYGTAPRAIAVTNDGDNNDLDETVYVAMFFGQLRAGKTAVQEAQDDQREGRVVAIAAGSNTPVSAPNPILLAPLANAGFNSNGRLAPGPGQVANVPSTNPQTFTTPTAAFPNQLASIAVHPFLRTAYVVSTGAAPNGPLRFNSNNQGLVSVYDTLTRSEITAGQTDPAVRRTAPLNLNQGVNLATTPAPRLFFTNPVAIAWRPDGSDAWVAIQNSDVVVRLTADGAGVPTIAAPLVAGPSAIVRVDLQDVEGREIPGKAPRGIVIDEDGRTAYVSNFISRSVTVIDITNPSAPEIEETALSTALPTPGTTEATALLGAELFYTGRGPEGRMSQESWGGCVTCHPNGRTDTVTWMFDAGPRQTISLDGMFDKNNPHDQRILNWSAVRDENQDFELNTRGVFNGRGLIDDDRLFLAMGGASGATPSDTSVVEQFQQFTGAVTTTNDLSGGAALPALLGARRDFAAATLDDDRVFIIGGRTGSGQGLLVTGANTVLEFNPRTNTLTPKNATGFTPRHSLGAAAVRTSQGNRIYAIGGYASAAITILPVNTVEEYNPSTDTWRTVASLPTAVAQFGIAVAGGINTAEPLQLIHVVSGNTASEVAPSVGNPTPVQRFQADASGSGTWTGFNPAGLTLRRNHGAAAAIRVVTSRVFVIGGQDGTGAVLSSVEEYLAQAVTLVATPHTALPAPRARFGVASTLTTNQIYVMGGIDNTGADQSTILELTVGNNGPVPGPPGTPSGAFATRGNLSSARHGLQVSNPLGITNFLPARSGGRDARQDAIATWIALKVRSSRAPLEATEAAVVSGRALFSQVGLVQAGFSCGSCHGGPKWTRSTVDYAPPPSPEVGIGFGNQRIIGAELRQTLTQGTAVLINVGTFTLGGGRENEIRSDLGDIGRAVGPLGANGFNIPSLLSVHESAPYFYSGLASTLEEVLNGSQDNFGGTRHHFVANPANRQDLIAFLRSIDDTTLTVP